jgi:hypothetical protein
VRSRTCPSSSRNCQNVKPFVCGYLRPEGAPTTDFRAIPAAVESESCVSPTLVTRPSCSIRAESCRLVGPPWVVQVLVQTLRLKKQFRLPREHQRVIHGLVVAEAPVFMPHVLEILHVPAEGAEHRVDQRQLRVLLANAGATVAGIRAPTSPRTAASCCACGAAEDDPASAVIATKQPNPRCRRFFSGAPSPVASGAPPPLGTNGSCALESNGPCGLGRAWSQEVIQ